MPFQKVNETLTGNDLCLDKWWSAERLGPSFNVKIQYELSAPLAEDIDRIKATITAGVTTAEPGVHVDSPDFIFRISAADYLAMLNRTVNVTTLFMSRRLTIEYASPVANPQQLLSKLNSARIAR